MNGCVKLKVKIRTKEWTAAMKLMGKILKEGGYVECDQDGDYLNMVMWPK